MAVEFVKPPKKTSSTMENARLGQKAIDNALPFEWLRPWY
ncbi:hypothetical protein L1275_000106 [Flavobacterium sp. HSC-61S13]|nr:hypothetical protein [Flavobacterium sp. HSC-61S13]